MNFTEQARKKATPYWEGSFVHPFIEQLQNGKLPASIFRYYLIQDRYYLEHFSQLHFLIAEKSESIAVKDMLIQAAEALESGEIFIRQQFFSVLNITEQEIKNTPIAPTAYHYVSHMYRQLLEGTTNSAIAGLLPCSWLYQEIGKRLTKTGSPDPLYQQWINTYSSDELVEQVLENRSLIDMLYQNSNLIERKQMDQAFQISSQMEYAFWNMAMNLETWPLGSASI